MGDNNNFFIESLDASGEPKTLRQAIYDLVQNVNATAPIERRITPLSAWVVAERSLVASGNRNAETRKFLVVRDVANFITLALDGTTFEVAPEHTDLLSVSHPLSSAKHSLTASGLRKAQARWIASDPRIDESVRPLVASAYAARPDSAERVYFFAKLAVTDSTLVPFDIAVDVDALVAAFNPYAGGNSRAARSMRARLQRRDSKGRFAEMGGGLRTYLKDKQGLVTSEIGRVAGSSADGKMAEVEFKNHSFIPDGIYYVDASKAEALQGILPESALKNLPQTTQVDQNIDATPVEEFLATQHDAPTGWTKDSKHQKQDGGPDSVYKSEDGYIVEKYDSLDNSNKDSALNSGTEISEGANDLGAGKSGKFVSGQPVYVLKRDASIYKGSGETEVVARTQSWADVQVSANNDQDSFDKAIDDAPEDLSKSPANNLKIPADVVNREQEKGDGSMFIPTSKGKGFVPFTKTKKVATPGVQLTKTLKEGDPLKTSDLEGLPNGSIISDTAEDGRSYIKINGDWRETDGSGVITNLYKKDLAYVGTSTTEPQDKSGNDVPEGWIQASKNVYYSPSGEFQVSLIQGKGYDSYNITHVNKDKKVSLKFLTSWDDVTKYTENFKSIEGPDEKIATLPSAEDVTLPTFTDWNTGKAYKLDLENYNPGNLNNDPKYLATTRTTEQLSNALAEAIANDGSANVYPDSKTPHKYADAESIYMALKEQGVDADLELAKAYDKAIGGNINVAKLQKFRKQEPEKVAELDKAGTAIPEGPNVSKVDAVISDIQKVHDLKEFKKVGQATGSNPGGFYEDAEGNQIYVKEPQTTLHGENEVAAAAFYEALGIPTAQIRKGILADGTEVTFSTIVPNNKKDFGTKVNDADYRKKVQEGFAVDAWLSNWDVAGTGFDNIVTDANGEPVRIDPGGALLFRAMGEPKGGAFGDTAGEIDTLHHGTNPYSEAVFGEMSDADIAESAKLLLNISDEQIDDIVDAAFTSDPSKASEVADKLKARREDILTRFGLGQPEPSTATDEPADVDTPDDSQESEETAPNTPTLEGYEYEQNANGAYYPTTPLTADDYNALRTGEKVPAQLPFIPKNTLSGDTLYFDSEGNKHWGQFGASGTLIRQIDENGDAKFLVVKRSSKASTGGGVWSVPGGAHDSKQDAETPGATSKRELSEELGWKLPDDTTPSGSYNHEVSPDWNYTYDIFDVSNDTEPKLSKELTETKWVSAAELEEMQKNGELHEAITPEILSNLIDQSANSDYNPVKVKGSKWWTPEKDENGVQKAFRKDLASTLKKGDIVTVKGATGERDVIVSSDPTTEDGKISFDIYNPYDGSKKTYSWKSDSEASILSDNKSAQDELAKAEQPEEVAPAETTTTPTDNTVSKAADMVTPQGNITFISSKNEDNEYSVIAAQWGKSTAEAHKKHDGSIAAVVTDSEGNKQKAIFNSVDEANAWIGDVAAQQTASDTNPVTGELVGKASEGVKVLKGGNLNAPTDNQIAAIEKYLSIKDVSPELQKKAQDALADDDITHGEISPIIAALKDAPTKDDSTLAETKKREALKGTTPLNTGKTPIHQRTEEGGSLTFFDDNGNKIGDVAPSQFESGAWSGGISINGTFAAGTFDNKESALEYLGSHLVDVKVADYNPFQPEVSGEKVTDFNDHIIDDGDNHNLTPKDPTDILDPNLIMDEVAKKYPDHTVMPNGDLLVNTKEYTTGKGKSYKYEVFVRRTKHERFYTYIKETDLQTGEQRVFKLGGDQFGENHSFKALNNKINRANKNINSSNPRNWFTKQKTQEFVAVSGVEETDITSSLVSYLNSDSAPKSPAELATAISEFVGSVGGDNVTVNKEILDAIAKSNGLHPGFVDDVLNKMAENKAKAAASLPDSYFAGKVLPEAPHLSYDGKTPVKVGDYVDWTDKKTGKVYRGQVIHAIYKHDSKDYLYSDQMLVVFPELNKENGYPENIQRWRVSPGLQIVDKNAPISEPFYFKEKEKATQEDIATGITPEYKPTPKGPTAREKAVEESPTAKHNVPVQMPDGKNDIVKSVHPNKTENYYDVNTGNEVAKLEPGDNEGDWLVSDPFGHDMKVFHSKSEAEGHVKEVVIPDSQEIWQQFENDFGGGEEDSTDVSTTDSGSNGYSKADAEADGFEPKSSFMEDKWDAPVEVYKDGNGNAKYFVNDTLVFEYNNVGKNQFKLKDYLGGEAENEFDWETEDEAAHASKMILKSIDFSKYNLGSSKETKPEAVAKKPVQQTDTAPEVEISETGHYVFDIDGVKHPTYPDQSTVSNVAMSGTSTPKKWSEVEAGDLLFINEKWSHVLSAGTGDDGVYRIVVAKFEDGKLSSKVISVDESKKAFLDLQTTAVVKPQQGFELVPGSVELTSPKDTTPETMPHGAVSESIKETMEKYDISNPEISKSINDFAGKILTGEDISQEDWDKYQAKLLEAVVLEDGMTLKKVEKPTAQEVADSVNELANNLENSSVGQEVSDVAAAATEVAQDIPETEAQVDPIYGEYSVKAIDFSEITIYGGKKAPFSNLGKIKGSQMQVGDIIRKGVGNNTRYYQVLEVNVDGQRGYVKTRAIYPTDGSSYWSDKYLEKAHHSIKVSNFTWYGEKVYRPTELTKNSDYFKKIPASEVKPTTTKVAGQVQPQSSLEAVKSLGVDKKSDAGNAQFGIPTDVDGVSWSQVPGNASPQSLWKAAFDGQKVKTGNDKYVITGAVVTSEDGQSSGIVTDTHPNPSDKNTSMLSVTWVQGDLAGQTQEFIPSKSVKDTETWVSPEGAASVGVTVNSEKIDSGKKYIASELADIKKKNADYLEQKKKEAEIQAAQKKLEAEIKAKKDAETVKGAGIERAEPVPIMDWDESAYSNLPSLQATLDDSLNATGTASSFGSDVLVDSDNIEDNILTVSSLEGADGKSITKLNFTLTSWTVDDVNGPGFLSELENNPEVKKSNGIKAQKLQYQSDDKKYKKLDEYVDSHYIGMGEGVTYEIPVKNDKGEKIGVARIFRAKDDKTAPNFISQNAASYNGPLAFHNKVEVIFDDHATPSDVEAALKAVGVKEARPATSVDMQTTLENKIVSLFGNKPNGSVNYSGELRQKILDSAKEKYNLTPENMVPEIKHGNIQFHATDEIAAALTKDLNFKYLRHAFSPPSYGNSGKALGKWMFNEFFGNGSGGLRSAADRALHGIYTTPGSGNSDIFNTGGAYVFMGKNTKSHYGSGRPINFYPDPKKVVSRLSLYGYDGDGWGTLTPNQLQTLSSSSLAEVLTKGEVPYSDMLKVGIKKSSDRTAIIAYFQSQGISEINGIPLNDFFVYEG